MAVATAWADDAAVFVRAEAGDSRPSVRHLHHHVAGDHRLAAQPRMQGQAGGHLQAVGFLLLDRREVALALSDDHMAGGAGATPSADVLQRRPEVERDVEQRSRLAVVVVGLCCHASYGA